MMISQIGIARSAEINSLERWFCNGAVWWEMPDIVAATSRPETR
jgi:hypothetical protein